MMTLLSVGGLIMGASVSRHRKVCTVPDCRVCGTELNYKRSGICRTDECRTADAVRWLEGRVAETRQRLAARRSTTRKVLTAKQRNEIHEAHDWTCYLCGDPIDREARYPHPLSATVDHKVPLSQGGSNDPSNLGSTHSGCNQSKHAKTPEQYRANRRTERQALEVIHRQGRGALTTRKA